MENYYEKTGFKLYNKCHNDKIIASRKCNLDIFIFDSKHNTKGLKIIYLILCGTYYSKLLLLTLQKIDLIVKCISFTELDKIISF